MSSDNTQAPEIHVKKRRMPRLSAVWLVPFIALFIALFIAFQQYAEQGPLITVEFETASGIVPDSTPLKYRDVTVGMVEDVDFSEDLKHIRTHIRIEPEFQQFIDADAKFWLVQPEVTTRGVSGLNTILSGVYIGVQWDANVGEPETAFTALANPPLGGGEDGLYFTLRASNGAGVADDTPIVYRGLEVGRISNPRLSSDGVSVIADAFISSPIDMQITTATRFWDTSGFNFSIGPTGAELNVDSFATLLAGGVSFDNIGQTGRHVPDGTVFELYSDENLARNSIFGDSDAGLPVDIAIVFDDDLNGLSAGAAVEFRGIRIGEVSRLVARTINAPTGDVKIQTLAYVQLSPAKMGLEAIATNEEVYDFLDSIAQEGVKARLARGGILSGGLKIIFTAPPAEAARAGLLNRNGDPYPIFPSTPAELPDTAATAEGVFQRINDLPIEELLNSAINVLDSTNLIINSPEMRDIPGEVAGILGDVRNVTGAEAVQALPDELAALITSLNNSVNAIEGTVTDIQDQQLVASLVGALDAFANSAETFDQSIAGLPAIVSEIQTVVENAANVPLEELTTRTSDLIATAEELIATEDAKAVPAALNEALSELSATLAELRDGGLINNANATLASASNAADSIATAVNDLPALIDSLQATVAEANATINGYQADSQFGREVSSAMRDLSQAARSLDSLARKIERNPNSLLFGR